MALLLGIGEQIKSTGGSFLSMPELFAWGTPTFNWGVVITCAVGSLMLLANLIASINGMADVTGDEVSKKRLNRSVSLYGLTGMMAGILPTVGFVPFASSMGVISMTGVASRRPFYLGSAFMIGLGLIAPVGAFFASIPPAVGYSAMMIVFALIFGQGLRELQRIEFTPRENFIVGISMLVGMGIMFLPTSIFVSIPGFAKFIFSNGLIDGMLMTIILEQLILRGEGKN
jgi:xanthine/uracil permease